MLLVLLTRILVWAAVGLLIWYVLLKFIPRNFLTWFGGAIILALIVLSFIDPNDQTIGAIWQVISLPLTPLGAAVLLLVFSLSEGLKKVKGRQVAIALSILLLSSIPLLARTLVAQAEQAVEEAYNAQRELCTDICPAVGDVPVSQVAAIVAVSEPMDAPNIPDDFPSQIDEGNSFAPELTSRLNSAASLHRSLRNQGINPLVIVTAGPVAGSEEEQQQKSQALRQQLANGGVPADRIVVEDTGMDMHRGAETVRDLLDERGLLTDDDTPERERTRVVLVAPALSMRRAALTYEETGLEVVAWPTNLYGYTEPTGDDTLAQLADLIPSVEALRLTTRYWEELLTSIYYFLRGWLPPFNVRWETVVETYQP
ncbi:uncharacterized protein XM38_008710 [Halomicronema hongdechloris C2206]|uniref:DUF218 domain-containing protein n=1 Tax=Halomicronema hongdechloris C2206 TaxID=1641165 RepID=A0A1Z3HI31_9CYAN|nr:ElyC/SanA/YdcF family protein [Halomicronema hongdechloris]ASC69941.1 uncharacterized protein XM38_008710 [Halomicronema hongdechloris C2206]